MKVGSLVELVKDDFYYNKPIVYPVKNKVYTIREIKKSIAGDPMLLLEEIINKKRIYDGQKLEDGWKIHRFRELQPPIANIEEHINENTIEPELA